MTDLVVDDGLVIRGVFSDGTRNPESTIAYAFGDLEQGNALTDKWKRADGTPKYTAVLRPVTNEVQQRLQRKHTSKVGTKSGIVEKFDRDEYTLDLFDHLIVEWSPNILGEDHKTLVCTRRTKILLDADRLAHMMKVASASESPEVEAASFRESA